MSFDRDGLVRALADGPVVRVVLAETRGSAPRGAGTAMLVTADGQDGTIGGGTLEFEATHRARRMLAAGVAWEVWRLPLGPALGQCCGGAVTVLAELFQTAPDIADFPLARPVTAPAGPMPPAVARARAAAKGPVLVAGWLVEPLRQTGAPVWIWGAGHVGRALVDVLAPLPDLSLTWIDDAPARFPAVISPDVTALPAPDMPAAMARAPGDAHHVILTYSHDIDLALCHAALGHGFAGCGLIGSATKWARFRSRLAALGHSDAAILRIACPIGDPTLGKHPQAIAVGVAAKLLTALKTPAVAPSARAAPA